MNLFRSEQHAQQWKDWDQEMASTLRPVEWWTEPFRNPIFRNRNRSDYLTWLTGESGISATAAFHDRLQQ